MAQHKYAFQSFDNELMARAIGRDLAISTKQAIEICNHLRHRKLIQAKRILEDVIEQKQAIPFKRFMNGLGHKPGKIAAGRYPSKASKACLGLLESVEANAQTKGLNTNELEIVHICAHKAHCPVHYGRHQGREFKRTHVEVVVQETVKKETKKQKTEKKDIKTPEAKTTEPKPAEKKTEEKKPAVEPKAEATKTEKQETKPAQPEAAEAPKADEKKPEAKTEQSQEKKEEVGGKTAEEK